MALRHKKRWERSRHQSIIASLAESRLREKSFFVTRTFSKPCCHAEKHAFNKTFLTSLLFPSLPFGRRKVVLIMWTPSTENYRCTLVSAETENCHWEGCVTSYKEGYSEEWEVFQDCHFLSKILFAGRLQGKCPLCGGHSHIPLRCFVCGVYECRAGKDLILAGMN